MSTRDKLLRLRKQLQKIDERLDKLYTQQARSFYKATTRIFKDGFCPDLALKILTQAHETAVAIQKQEEETRLFKEASDIEPSNSENKSGHGYP